MSNSLCMNPSSVSQKYATVLWFKGKKLVKVEIHCNWNMCMILMSVVFIPVKDSQKLIPAFWKSSAPHLVVFLAHSIQSVILVIGGMYYMRISIIGNGIIKNQFHYYIFIPWNIPKCGNCNWLQLSLTIRLLLCNCYSNSLTAYCTADCAVSIYKPATTLQQFPI